MTVSLTTSPRRPLASDGRPPVNAAAERGRADGLAAGRAAERARVRAILNAPEAVGRATLAGLDPTVVSPGAI